MAKRGLKVTPTSAVASQFITDNIEKNMDLIPVWFERCKPHSGRAFICSAGPSLKLFLQKVKDNPEDYLDATFFCVKHSLPKFKEFGIKPHFCSVLDPRPINEVSTLGEIRSNLYSCADKDIVFVVASMTNYTVTEWLQENGYKILGYHTATPEINDLTPEKRKIVGDFIITGGTSSATRCIEIASFMGFSDITLVGFDSSFSEPKPTNILDIDGKQLYIKVTVGDEPFWTSGEFIAQGQDVQALLSNSRTPVPIKLEEGLSTSMVNAIERVIGNKTLATKDWRTYLDLQEDN